jgi:galactose mutarotase-like enzyme
MNSASHEKGHCQGNQPIPASAGAHPLFTIKTVSDIALTTPLRKY